MQTVCLLLFLSLFCDAQGRSRKLRPVDNSAAWLAAYDSTNWDGYLKFLQTNFATPPGRGFQDPALRDRTGGYDLKKIESENSTKVTALVQERAGDGFARLTLEVESPEPHRILKLDVNLIERPAEFALPHMSDQSLVAALRKRLDNEASADRFAGAVLVAKQGKPIFAQAYGLADREHKIPNTLHTRFTIASMNKMFTAVATMQLVQAGKLALDDPLGKYLTDYPNKELAAKVTIGELLTNTGGTGDIWGPEFDKHRLQLRTPQDYIHLYGQRRAQVRARQPLGVQQLRLHFARRGDRKSERRELLQLRARARLPSRRHDLYQLGTWKTRRSRIAASTTQRWEHPTGFRLPKARSNAGTPAGGGYSTVGDLLRFADALRENKLLDAHYTKLLTTGRVATPFGFEAYGFGVQTINGNQVLRP